MAVLTRAERKKIASPWVREVIRDKGQAKTLTVTDLEGVAQYTEDWFTANVGSYISGLPPGFQAATDLDAQALFLAYTAMKRAGLL